MDALVDRAGEARVALLGWASLGTHESCAWRVNRFVAWRPRAGDDARRVLTAFDRSPTGMWANEVADLAAPRGS